MLSAFRTFPDMSVERFPTCPYPVLILHSVLFAFRAVPNVSVSSLNSSLCIIYPYSCSERVSVQSSIFTLCCLPLEQFPPCPCPVLIIYSVSFAPIAVPNVSVSIAVLVHSPLYTICPMTGAATKSQCPVLIPPSVSSAPKAVPKVSVSSLNTFFTLYYLPHD